MTDDPRAERKGRGSLAGRLSPTDDWDSAATNDPIARDFGLAPTADQPRSLSETAHLLHSSANAERLLRSIADAEAGHTEVRGPVDPDHGDE